MADPLAPPLDPRRALALAARDRPAAQKQIAALSDEQQLALVCSAAPRDRSALLGLLPEPERVIPRLPEAELCFTVQAAGLESASWLLEHATPEQVVAAVDLDGWQGKLPLPERLEAWFAALAALEEETVLRDLRALDAELVVHYLSGSLEVELKPNDDEGWQAREGFQTLDGQFYFAARGESRDAAAQLRILRILFQHDYWTYFRLLQGVIWELESDTVEWALRWRQGRLQDLGFPPWEEALSIYRHLAPENRAEIDPDAHALDADEWDLPVWIPELPAEASARGLLFRAMAELAGEERRAAFYAFVALANKVAVADDMDLGDVDTTPRAIAKAARWASRGLEYVAEQNGLGAAETLRHVGLERLFRVGANLEPEAARPPEPTGPEPPDDPT